LNINFLLLLLLHRLSLWSLLSLLTIQIGLLSRFSAAASCGLAFDSVSYLAFARGLQTEG
jgi:hypothetical protein